MPKEVEEKEYQGNSAIFHAIPNLIFVKDKIGFQITKIDNDSSDNGLYLQNPERLKKLLFERILNKYMKRINHYEFNENKRKLNNGDYDNFILRKYRFKKNEEFDADISDLDSGGKFSVYPLTFICSNNFCGYLETYDSKNKIENFTNKCKLCGSQMKQSTILLFCETCGKVEEFKFSCGDGFNHDITVRWKKKDSLRTWKVHCETCKKKFIDILSLQCNHKEYGKTVIDSEKKTKKTTITVKEGSGILPAVETFIDIPNPKGCDYIDIEDLPYYLLLINQNMLKDEDIDSLEVLMYYVFEFHDKTARKAQRLKPKNKKLSDEEFESFWVKETYHNEILTRFNEVRAQFSSVNIENINNYAAILKQYSSEEISGIGPQKYSEYLKTLPSENFFKNKPKMFEEIKNELFIEEIYYIPEVRLIQACFGVIYGFNKFYDRNWVNHFEPIWENTYKKEKFFAYSNVYENEGILFELSKTKILKWLIENEFIDKPNDQITDEIAQKILLNLEEKSKAYSAVYCLIHSFSHLLITHASIYTGLSSDSSGELIFPNMGACFIYSTSSINIGGFYHVFKYDIENWLSDLKLNVRNCVFDPDCLKNQGTCFSCLYIAEYSCNNFNKELDRDVFLGKTARYKKGFWY